MAFESLAYRYTFTVSDFPERWLPLVHLYDPDLPLFPIYYFHILSPRLSVGERPSDTDRVFGYIEKINLSGENAIEVTAVLSKNLAKSENDYYLGPLEAEIKNRLGVLNPVVQSEIGKIFNSPLDNANKVIYEIWQRVVVNAYGNKLPFGRLWDEVLGLVRFVASWYSPSGRKGELIQTYYFVSRFGVKIQSAGDVPQTDFYLLPTIQELNDLPNPLTSFPQFTVLLDVANRVQKKYCSLININGIRFSKFNNPSKKLKTSTIFDIFSKVISDKHRALAIECFNAFNKGPQRTIIFLLMLDDIRQGRIDPANLVPAQLGAIYDSLHNTYQSPKVIEIYAQQCFGNVSAIPVDTWIDTFFKWPLHVFPTSKRKDKYQFIFSLSQNLGKVERLFWVAGQARKVHSSACNDALWCLKYGSAKEKRPRGANPFSCNICLESIRNCCPAYNAIKDTPVSFNPRRISEGKFIVRTTANNNLTRNQKFISCIGKSIYQKIYDDFSPIDEPNGFSPFPSQQHDGSDMTVDEFVRIY